MKRHNPFLSDSDQIMSAMQRLNDEIPKLPHQAELTLQMAEMVGADMTDIVTMEEGENFTTYNINPVGGGRVVAYVIGPVTGHENNNRDMFEAMRSQMNGLGFHTVIPHDLIPPDTPWLSAVAKSLTFMSVMAELAEKTGSIAPVVLLPGWGGSMGAFIEFKAAQNADMLVDSFEELKNTILNELSVTGIDLTQVGSLKLCNSGD